MAGWRIKLGGVMDVSGWFPKRVFLECTRTLNSPLHTGIERVVRNILAASAEVSASMGLVCCPVVFQPRHGFVPVEWELSLDANHGGLNLRESPLKRHLERLGVLDLARSCRRQFERYSSSIQASLQRFSRSRLQFNSHDVLLLLDSSWTSPYWHNVREAQEAGALVGAAVYDLLPIQLPDSMTVNQRASFGRWWDKAYQEIDFIATISQSVYRECLDCHEASGTRVKPLIGGAFPLGADLPTQPMHAGIRQSLLDLVTTRRVGSVTPFYLCVGTLSPRKQQSLVFEAFDKLWRQGAEASLVLVGSGGWHSEDLIRRLRSHAKFGTSLFWFSDLSDGELNWCYQHAAGLIAASQGEGFDLPVVEALSQQCPVFASDIPVHREVAGDFASYFGCGSLDRLTELLNQHLQCTLPFKRSSCKRFCWPSWRESCGELFRLIVQLARECKDHQLAKRGHAA